MTALRPFMPLRWLCKAVVSRDKFFIIVLLDSSYVVPYRVMALTYAPQSNRFNVSDSRLESFTADLNSALGISPSSKETIRADDTNIENGSPLKDGLVQALFAAVDRRIEEGNSEGFFCKPQIPFDIKDEIKGQNDLRLLKEVATEVRNRIIAKHTGKFDLAIKAKQPRGRVVLEVELKEIGKVKKRKPTIVTPPPVKTLPEPSNIFSRVERIVERTKDEVLSSGRSQFALSVDPTKFSSERDVNSFIEAIDRAGYNRAGLSVKVSSRSKQEAVNLWRQAQVKGEKVVFNLQAYFAPVDSVDALNSMALKMAQVLGNAKRNGSSAQVLVRLPAQQFVNEKKLAEILYDLQVKHPGMLNIKAPSGSESPYFIRAKNVWVLSGDQVEEFMPYSAAEVDLRTKNKVQLQEAPSESFDSLTDRMKLALYSTPEEGRKALWLTSQALNETVIGFLANFKRRHNLAIIADPQIKSDHRYRNLFAPRSFSQAFTSKVANIFKSLRGWWKG